MTLDVRIETDIRVNLAPVLKKDAAGLVAAAEAAVEETTLRMKERGRARLRIAFPGSRRIATTLAGEFFPGTAAKPPTGYLFSRWWRRGRDMLYAFAKGLIVRSRDGKLLLVPIDNSPGTAAKARAAAEALRGGTAPRIAIIKSGAGKLLLIEKGQAQTRVLATMHRFVKLPKKWNADDLPAEAGRLIEERLLAHLAARGL